MSEARVPSGLTETEYDIMMHLVKAWNLFATLPRQYPNEQLEFANAIHVQQNIIGSRGLSRLFPEFWKIGDDDATIG